MTERTWRTEIYEFFENPAFKTLSTVQLFKCKQRMEGGLLRWCGGKDPACQCRRCKSLIPGLGRSPGGGHGNILQYSCLENPTDRRAWLATVHGITRSRTQLKRLSTHTRKGWKWEREVTSVSARGLWCAWSLELWIRNRPFPVT